MLLKEYASILQNLIKSDWKICGIEKYLNNPIKRSVLLRHDVDRRIKKAITMAKLENYYGVKSTYYFRADKKGKFPFDAINQISKFGHEIGYHYETLSECNGDYEKAINLFKSNLEKLREHVDCRTVSMHGRPLSKYNNQNLLKQYNIKEFALLGDAVLDIQKHKPLYFTDVGGKWNHISVNLRDTLPGSRKIDNFSLTADNIHYLLSKDPGPIYISTHPERWADSFYDRIYCSTLDVVINVIKRSIKLVRITTSA